MKSVVNEKQTESKPKYPWIGKWNNNDNIALVVLFHEYKKGVVLASNSVDWGTIGVYYNYWAENEFTPFTGSITLSND